MTCSYAVGVVKMEIVTDDHSPKKISVPYYLFQERESMLCTITAGAVELVRCSVFRQTSFSQGTNKSPFLQKAMQVISKSAI